MQIPDDAAFDGLITKALDSLPQTYIGRMQNVAIVIADEPTPDQRRKMALRQDQTMLGLYEGIPLTKRGNNYTLVLPDKITLFKKPLVAACADLPALQEQIRHTLWHEIAHHFGLGHERIHRLE